MVDRASRSTEPPPLDAGSTDHGHAASAKIRQTIVGIIHSIGSDLDLDAGIRQGKADRALLVGATLRW